VRAGDSQASSVPLAEDERAIVLTEGAAVGVVLAGPPARTERQAAADISHELANALAAITGWARLARQGTDATEALELIESNATNAWTAARHILGKGGPARERSLDLSAFIEEVGRLVSWKARERGLDVRVAVEPGLRVVGDRGHAWSIFWNLAINALEALSRGGRLELRAKRKGGRAVIEVIDDGSGMTPEVRARAFERRFTTKPTGSGIGLALVKQTVERLGGSISLESEPGRGTHVTVELPSPTQTRREARRASGVFYAGPIHGRVLVVDDDDGVREMIATALRTRGAEVIALASADAALAADGPFDFAVLDLQLEGTQGDDLLARLRAKGIVSRGLLVSGAEHPRHSTPGGRPNAVLRKPFELDELFGLVPEDMRGDESDDQDGATRRL
jgi:CheY-like chemotaxis protein/two-component sensor histidine kinase